MKEIIIRSEIPMLSENGAEYRIRKLSGHEISGEPSLVIIHHPTLWDMLAETEAIRESRRGVQLAAIVEPFRRLLFEALFPAAVILDDGDDVRPDKLLHPFPQRKEIRFTEKEKRTLREMQYGLCSKELSVRLGITERSVRRVKEKLMRKTGLVSSEQLMIYALLSTRNSSHSADTV